MFSRFEICHIKCEVKGKGEDQKMEDTKKKDEMDMEEI
jgi:hypothetical protein